MEEVNFSDNYNHTDCAVFYTETNIPGPGSSAMLDHSLCVMCACEGVCGGDCACVRYSGAQCNYINNLLNKEKMSPSAVVLECNNLCKCSANCGNRLVQFGPKENLTVFPTAFKGCGLKTESFIKMGSFICEYAGELIDREEARKRAQHDGRNYIFVLKEHSSDSVTETIVDPTCIGNIGRYINHSCEPNAAIVPVRIDSPVPRLAVFAIVDIKPGEEITYDYGSGGTGPGSVPCACLSLNCHGFLPFDKNLLS